MATTSSPFAGRLPKKSDSTDKEKPVAATKAEPKDAAPAPAPAEIDDVMAALLAQMGEMELTEEDLEAPTAFIPYTMPAEHEYVPLKIVSAEVVLQEMTFFGGESPDLYPEPITLAIPRIKLEMDHASTAYGERGRPYLFSVPYMSVWMARKDGRRWKKTSGTKLFGATGLFVKGQKFGVTASSMDEAVAQIRPVVEKMVGRIIVGQIRYSTKTYTDPNPVRDANGDFVRDENGDLKMVVTESVRTFDNLKDDVFALPERGIVIDDETEAEITINTIGRVVATPVKINTIVAAVTHDKQAVLARWTGEGWTLHTEEEAKPGSVMIPGGDIFVG